MSGSLDPRTDPAEVGLPPHAVLLAEPTASGLPVPSFRVWLRRAADGAVLVRVFRGQILSTAAGFVTTAITPGIPVFRNRFVLAVEVHGGDGIKVAADGSYDRKAWRSTIAGVAAQGIGPADAGLSGVDFAYVRLRAWLLPGTDFARFDATLTFTAQ